MKTQTRFTFGRLGSAALVAAALVGAIGIGGCTSYYRITDPASKSEYYTTKYDKERHGAVSFKDDVTGRKVTLQSSEVGKISKETYREHVPK